MSLKKNNIIIFFLALFSLLISTPVLAGTQINSSLTVDERFETNPIYLPKGLQNDDFITTITPAVSFTQYWQKLEITGRYRAAIERFAKFDENNQVAHFASILITVNPSNKTTLTVGDEISKSANLFDISALAAGNIQIQRTTTIYNRLYAGITHDVTERLTMNLLVKDLDLEFDDPTQIDTRTESASVGFDYGLRGAWKTGATYRYDRYSFSRGKLGHEEIQFFSLHLTGQPLHTLFIDISGGGAYSADIASKADWIASGTIRKEFKRLTFAANFSRDITQSVGLTNDVTTNNVVSTTATADLTEKLALIITGNYGKSRSERNSILDTKSYGGSISGTYKLRSWASMGCGYTYFKQQAADNSAASNILNNSIFLNITLTPRKIKL